MSKIQQGVFLGVRESERKIQRVLMGVQNPPVSRIHQRVFMGVQHPFCVQDPPRSMTEFDGRCVLLGADAFPSRVAASLRTLGYSPERRLKLDLLKLSHHGSKGNTSPELLALIDCTRFAISTNGTQHSHPDPETIARILAADPGRPKQLLFNTRQPNAEIWENIALMTRWNYVCIFPDPPAHAGLEVEISRFLDTQ